jgi:hypothetical protein
MKRKIGMWVLLTAFLFLSVSACILVPVGDEHPHGDAYHDDHGHD